MLIRFSSSDKSIWPVVGFKFFVKPYDSVWINEADSTFLSFWGIDSKILPGIYTSYIGYYWGRGTGALVWTKPIGWSGLFNKIYGWGC